MSLLRKLVPHLNDSYETYTAMLENNYKWTGSLQETECRIRTQQQLKVL